VIAFVSDWAGDDDIYLYDLDSENLINLTGADKGANASGQDRDPAFGPDGQTLTFRSDVSGHWAYYQIDLRTGVQTPLIDGHAEPLPYRGRLSWGATGEGGSAYAFESYQDKSLDLYVSTAAGGRQPLVQGPAGDYGPAWRPGASQIAFASWRDGAKNVYLVDADGSHLTRLTDGPGDCEMPAWRPDGDRIAYVRWREGDADLWELDVETGETRPVAVDPYPDRSPTYAPDGRLFWTRYAPGESFEVHDAVRPGRWQLWMRAGEGPERPVPLPVADMDVYAPVAGYLSWPVGASLLPVTPGPTATPESERWVELQEVDVQVAGNDPQLHADVVSSYAAWRAEVLEMSGHDLLGYVSDMFRPLGYSRHPYGHLSWHRTGRAVDLLFEWRDLQDTQSLPEGPNRLLVVREDLGPQTYWRLYLHCQDQDGTMGEPLTVAPWVFWFDLDRAKEPEAYRDGGKPGAIPEGYYVDVTRLAKRHGWYRIASYEEADFDWRWDSLGREFWHYQRTDGLMWWQAMRQLYPLETLESYYGWSTCVDELGLDPAWLEAKGIPTPAP
jgi:TolB protein